MLLRLPTQSGSPLQIDDQLGVPPSLQEAESAPAAAERHVNCLTWGDCENVGTPLQASFILVASESAIV